MAASNPEHYHYTEDKSPLVLRIRQIKGQALGIQRMIEADHYSADVIQQLSDISAAANYLSVLILEKHIERNVANAIREQSGQDYIDELMLTLRRVIKRR